MYSFLAAVVGHQRQRHVGIVAAASASLTSIHSQQPASMLTPRPQGADGDVKWVLFQLGYYSLGLFGVIGFCVSGLWLVHIIVYLLPPVPIHPLLNTM